ncbi:MAG: hypothetical protein H6Q70_3033 [Firmicutes bacterium]|nr:hypothetical protein [Bacillota bacterium]
MNNASWDITISRGILEYSSILKYIFTGTTVSFVELICRIKIL